MFCRSNERVIIDQLNSSTNPQVPHPAPTSSMNPSHLASASTRHNGVLGFKLKTRLKNSSQLFAPFDIQKINLRWDLQECLKSPISEQDQSAVMMQWSYRWWGTIAKQRSKVSPTGFPFQEFALFDSTCPGRTIQEFSDDLDFCAFFQWLEDLLLTQALQRNALLNAIICQKRKKYT